MITLEKIAGVNEVTNRLVRNINNLADRALRNEPGLYGRAKRHIRRADQAKDMGNMNLASEHEEKAKFLAAAAMRKQSDKAAEMKQLGSILKNHLS